MRIGLDLDDTVTGRDGLPAFFALLSQALVRAGHEVHIISFRYDESRKATLSELRELGIWFTALHLTTAAGPAPAAWKARLAEQLGLDVMVEDSLENLAAMPARTRSIWVCPRRVDLGAVSQVLIDHEDDE